MTIEPIISKYIDESVERASKKTEVNVRSYFDGVLKEYRKEDRIYFEENRKDFLNHMAALKEGHRDDIKLIKEYCSGLASREEIRQIFDEKNSAIEKRLSIVTGEVAEHARRLNKHDKRLTKLENVLV